MVTDLVNRQAELLEKVIIEGDLEKLSSAERMEYYEKVCDSLGLNPLTRPFDYIKLSGKLTLYAKKDATEQLAKMHHVSIKLQSGRSIEGGYLVQATASTEYRSVDATGAVPTESLKGESKAVLRLVGLGWLDETEVAAVPDAVQVVVDPATGEIVPPASAPSSTGEQAAGPTGASQEALHALNEARKQAGMSADEMVAMSTNRFGVGPRDLNSQHLEELTAMVGQSGDEAYAESAYLPRSAMKARMRAMPPGLMMTATLNIRPIIQGATATPHHTNGDGGESDASA